MGGRSRGYGSDTSFTPERSTAVVPRAENTGFLKDNHGADLIENFELTSEGTLRSIIGPAPFSYDYAQTPPTADVFADRIYGLFYTRLAATGRELFLVHSGASLYSYYGWEAVSRWVEILGPSATFRQGEMHNDGALREPTQFVATPRGVIIISQTSGAWFYDGEEILPLGYARRPGPPQGIGPSSSAARANTSGGSVLPGTNDRGYAHDAQLATNTGMNAGYGTCFVGTVEPFPGVSPVAATTNPTESIEYALAGEVGRLLPGEWRARVQWVDLWGNLSPWSSESNTIRMQSQAARVYDRLRTGDNKWQSAAGDRARKQIAWVIENGPEGTIGKNIARTRDLINSGSADYYEMPGNPAGNTFGYATISDNESTMFPDNTHDGALFKPIEDIIPVGKMRLATIAFGRLWATFEDEPGVVRFSVPGLYGTFRRFDFVPVDVRNDHVTGIQATTTGVIVSTEYTTHIIQAAVDSYNGFRAAGVSARIGCIAPDSMQALQDGSVIWLSRSGFVRFTGDTVENIQPPMQYGIERINWGRARQATAAVHPENNTYICWLPLDGAARNNVGFIYRDGNWRRRTDVALDCLGTVENHRGYLWGGGVLSGVEGLWVLDHESQYYPLDSREAVIESGWIHVTDSETRRSEREIILWLRETCTGTLTVEIFRDFRMDVIHTETVDLVSDEQNIKAPIYGEAVLDDVETPDGSPNKWRRRRPFHKRVQFAAPSAEMFKVRLRSASLVEFIAFTFNGIVYNANTGRVP